MIGSSTTIPLHRVELQSDLISGIVELGVTSSLPVAGIHLLLGNDLAGDKVRVEPVVSEKPHESPETESLEDEFPGLFPACVTTRSMTKKQATMDEFDALGLDKTFMTDIDSDSDTTELPQEFTIKSNRESLIQAQDSDHVVSQLKEQALSSEEADKVPVCYTLISGVLVRKWRCPLDPGDYEAREQIVVPVSLRAQVLELAHDHPMAGHLAVRKTKTRLLEHFWWPGISKDVSEHCRTCDTCQVVGKPN